MNVGVVLPGFSASEEDWCIPALASLIRRLGERHRVRVVSLRYPHQRKRYSVFGVEVHALGGARVQGLRKFSLLARALATLGREHRRRPFDILHAFWADEPGWVTVRAGRWLGVPSLVTLLGGELEGASLVSVGSSHLARLAKPRSPKTTWLPIGVDLERFHPTSKTDRPSLLEGGIKLLHVGSLVPVKGQESLLRAFEKVTLSIPDAVLHLVGESPLRESLERRLAGELGICERVHFHGAVPHHHLPAYYRAADLCVMSSLHRRTGLGDPRGRRLRMRHYSLRDTLERLGLLYTKRSSRGPARALAPRSMQT